MQRKNPVPGILGFSHSQLQGESDRRIEGRGILLSGRRSWIPGAVFKSGRKGSLSFYEYGYHSIPNCYAPLDMDAVNTAGISAVQNFPTLMTMGEGIMIGFVDTGIDYTNPVFRSLDGSTGFWGSGTRPFRTAIRRRILLWKCLYKRRY